MVHLVGEFHETEIKKLAGKPLNITTLLTTNAYITKIKLSF